MTISGSYASFVAKLSVVSARAKVETSARARLAPVFALALLDIMGLDSVASVGVAAAQGVTTPRAATGPRPAAATEAAAAKKAGEPAAAPASGDAAAVDTVATGITLPELLREEAVQRPPGADEVEGRVVLKLTVEKDGSVSAAEVVSSLAPAFDEAARAAALKFVFKPASRDGVAMRAIVSQAVVFEKLEPLSVVEDPAATPSAATLGNLGGQLKLLETDMPVAGVAVKVRSPAGQLWTVVSDANGKWGLEGLLPGTYTVTVAADGFQDMGENEDVVAGNETSVTYRLAPLVEGLEVTVTGERPPREVTRRTIERREIARIPGSGGDALRSLQSLPGVARPPGLAGLLIVRGSAPEDTETFVDGLGVPIIYHFGGLSSVVPTELLERIDFYPGNFSARYGRVMGGIVDVGLRKPNTECFGDYGKPSTDSDNKDGCYHGMLQLDLIDTRAMLQGPISKEWSFAVAGRRSWVDTWLGPVLEEAGAGITSAPVYYDYQLIAEHRPNANTRFSTRFFGSDDRLELLIKNPASQDPGFFGGNVRFHTGFYRAQMLFSTELTREIELEATVAVGKDEIEFTLGQLAFNLKGYPILSRNELRFKLMKGFKLDMGIDYLAAPFDILVRAPEPPRPGEPSPGPFTSRPVLEQQQSGLVFRPGWYAEAEIRPADPLLIVPGLRIDHARDSGHTDVSPRVNARYDLVGGGQSDASAVERPRRTTLKAGVGYFYQPPQFQETDTVFGTPGLDSNRSIAYTFGVEQELTDQIEVTVEGYYKDLDVLVSRAAGASGFNYNNAGSGRVIGAETLVKYKADDRFFGWLAYTLSRSERRNSDDEPEYLFQFDQTHILTMLGSYRLGRGWEVGARFRVVSGPLYTPTPGAPGLPALYAADAATYTQLEGPPFSRRLPLFHQLDLRIDKAWQFRDWRLSAYLDLWNAYNNAAVEGVTYNFDFTQRAFQTGLPIIPSFGLRGEF